jgi:Pvc16 N-terminal domain
MIHEVDEALRGLLGEGILRTTGAEVVFEAPRREWAARRAAPTVDLFLYDIQEDVARRQAGRIGQPDADGAPVALGEPPRWYRLSYLVTVWTKLPQDEHRLLSALLAGLVGEKTLPRSRLRGSLAELGLPVRLDIALPPADKRASADLWNALGGELRPSLDLVVTAPLLPPGEAAAPVVREAPEVRMLDRGEGEDSLRRAEARRSRYGGTAQAAGSAAATTEPTTAQAQAQAQAAGSAPSEAAGPFGAAAAMGARRVRGVPGRAGDGPARL